jgi:hypothetical protein
MCDVGHLAWMCPCSPGFQERPGHRPFEAREQIEVDPAEERSETDSVTAQRTREHQPHADASRHDEPQEYATSSEQRDCAKKNSRRHRSNIGITRHLVKGQPRDAAAHLTIVPFPVAPKAGTEADRSRTAPNNQQPTTCRYGCARPRPGPWPRTRDDAWHSPRAGRCNAGSHGRRSVGIYRPSSAARTRSGSR